MSVHWVSICRGGMSKAKGTRRRRRMAVNSSSWHSVPLPVSIRRMTQSLWVSVSVCPCSTGSGRESGGSFVFPGHPSCTEAQLMCRTASTSVGSDSLSLRKSSRGAAFLNFKEENRYAACSSTVFARPFCGLIWALFSLLF